MPRALLLLLVLAILVGCDRPFVEAVAPTLELVEPVSLDTVRTEPRLPLAFRASSFRAISRVEVNGEPATFLNQQEVYLDTLVLDVGLNTIRVDAFDSEGTAGTDTLYAVHFPYTFAEVATPLPAALGGHAATILRDGTLLITGGAPSVDAAASDQAFVFDPATFSTVALEARMVGARAGHTASLLPDGRVLILGGSTLATPRTRSDLVETVEVYDPETQTFTSLPLLDEDGAPGGANLAVQRAEHTTAILQPPGGESFAYLYGGLGPRFNADSVVPTEFMRTLRIEVDQVTAVGPRERFRFATITGHTQTPLDVDEVQSGGDGFGRYLVAGASLSGASETPAPFVFAFTPDGIGVSGVGQADARRTDHAAARLGEAVVVFGGREADAPNRVPATLSAVVPDADRAFAFPDEVRPLVERWDHTATNIGLGRILLVGGFSPSGDALDRTELFFPR